MLLIIDHLQRGDIRARTLGAIPKDLLFSKKVSEVLAALCTKPSAVL
jgi:hypothetical protein